MTTKLNLGSGSNAVDGWINIDNTWNIVLSKYKPLKQLLYKLGIISQTTFKTDWSNIVKYDIRKRLPFNDNSVDIVYSSHFIEHVTKGEAKLIITDVHRILKPNGFFRITVPDLNILATKYVNGAITIDEFIDETLFVPGNAPTFFESFYRHSHKWGYDVNSLIQLLRNCGFNQVYECDYRIGKCSDLDKLENHLDGVYLETIKNHEPRYIDLFGDDMED